jgi:hypothetical protein
MAQSKNFLDGYPPIDIKGQGSRQCNAGNWVVSSGNREAQAQEVTDVISPIEVNGQDCDACNAGNWGVSTANRLAQPQVVFHPLK